MSIRVQVVEGAPKVLTMKIVKELGDITLSQARELVLGGRPFVLPVSRSRLEAAMAEARQTRSSLDGDEWPPIEIIEGDDDGIPAVALRLQYMAAVEAIEDPSVRREEAKKALRLLLDYV